MFTRFVSILLLKLKFLVFWMMSCEIKAMLCVIEVFLKTVVRNELLCFVAFTTKKAVKSLSSFLRVNEISGVYTACLCNLI